jgi:hypothetical protein
MRSAGVDLSLMHGVFFGEMIYEECLGGITLDGIEVFG